MSNAPDGLNHKHRMVPFIDAHEIKEEDRIKLIGEYVLRLKSKRTGFMTDCPNGDHSKGNRYIKKLLEQYPMIEVKKRVDGPVDNVETIVVGLK